MATVYINKLLDSTETEGDTKAFFYLESKWLDDEINVRLQSSKSGKCYQGTITTEALKELATELDESFNTYYDECRLALTTYISLPGYIYKLDADESLFKIWKSKEDAISMLYLEISLKAIKNHYDILDSAIEQLQNNSKFLTERIEKAHKFDEHSRQLLEDFRCCVEQKNQIEKTLLRKAASLLHVKKQKICELKDTLAKYNNMEEDASDGHSDDEMRGKMVDDEEGPQCSRKRQRTLVDSDSEENDEFNANTEALTLPEMNGNMADDDERPQSSSKGPAKDDRQMVEDEVTT